MLNKFKVVLMRLLIICTLLFCASLMVTSVYNIANGSVESPVKTIEIIHEGNYYPNNAWEFQSHVFKYKEHLRENRDILCKRNKMCDLLAKTVLYEARGESIEGQKLVAQVVINRVQDSRFPNTIQGVVYQNKQFSFVADMHKQSTPDKKSIAIARKVAYDVLNGKIATDNKFLWYHSTNVKPKWAKGKKGVKVGNHIFYNAL